MKVFNHDYVVIAVYAWYTLLAYEAVREGEVEPFDLIFGDDIFYDRLIINFGLDVAYDCVKVNKNKLGMDFSMVNIFMFGSRT